MCVCVCPCLSVNVSPRTDEDLHACAVLGLHAVSRANPSTNPVHEAAQVGQTIAHRHGRRVCLHGDDPAAQERGPAIDHQNVSADVDAVDHRVAEGAERDEEA
jgi:hypothetical protein